MPKMIIGGSESLHIYIRLGAGDFSGKRYFSTILARRIHVGFTLVIFRM